MRFWFGFRHVGVVVPARRKARHAWVRSPILRAVEVAVGAVLVVVLVSPPWWMALFVFLAAGVMALYLLRRYL